MSALKLVSSPDDVLSTIEVIGLASDDDMAARLTTVIQATHEDSAPVLVGGLDKLIQELRSIPTPDVLLVDCGEENNLMGAVSQLADVCDPGVKVIVFGGVNDLSVRNDLISSGISEYFLRSVGVDLIIDAVSRLKVPEQSLPVHVDVDDARHEAKVIGVLGAAGGVGASTIVANLSWFDASTNAVDAVLIDLDLVFGTQAVHFDIDPGAGLVDAMISPDRLDDLFTKRVMIKVAETFRVIAAEAELDKANVANAPAFALLLNHMKSQARRIYIDFPRYLIVEDPQYLRDLDHLVVVAAPSLVSLRDTNRLIKWLRQHEPELQITVVLNSRDKAAKQELDIKSFAENLSHPVACEIPADPKTLSQSEANGKCAVQQARKSKFAVAIAKCSGHLIDADIADEKSVARKSVFALFRKSKNRAD